jgi:hypothetical protein
MDNHEKSKSLGTQEFSLIRPTQAIMVKIYFSGNITESQTMYCVVTAYYLVSTSVSCPTGPTHCPAVTAQGKRSGNASLCTNIYIY